MRTLPVLTLAVFLASCAPTASVVDQSSMSSMDHSMHASEDGGDVSSADRLNSSPRHQEWVEVKNGDKTIYTWVVYPETSEKRPVVILIHENKGLNDWARGMADQVAEAGYIAVAPDLLSQVDATHERTGDFTSDDEATKAISSLKPEIVQADLKAVADWAKTIPAANGKLVSAGFCWGGAQSFQFATTNPDLAATLVFYGTGPTDADAYGKIKSPVYGFYGGADARVNATVPESDQYMTAANKRYDYVMYDGAGHAFMRSGEDPNGDAANVAARNAAWERMKQILGSL